MLVDAGFTDVRVEEKAESREFIKDWMPGSGAEDYVVSANVTARKPLADVKADVDADVDAAASASAAALFARTAGVSLAAAGPVGRAVGELVSAVGGVVRMLAEHHGEHTDAPAAEVDCADPEVPEEKKAGC